MHQVNPSSWSDTRQADLKINNSCLFSLCAVLKWILSLTYWLMDAFLNSNNA